MSIFKACDIRGAYPHELDERLYDDLGRAVGTVLREKSGSPHVLVAGDVRLSTPALQAALIGGLVATGCRVANLGMAPTPVAHFAGRRLHPDGMAIVTGSHNPPGDNGLKLSFGLAPVTAMEMGYLEGTLASRHFAAGRGSVEAVSVTDAYDAWLCASATPGDDLRIVLDCGNGAYSELAPRVLRHLGYDVVELFCTPDGRFPNRPPNPSVPANLSALCQAVPQAGAALGVALDGDGDRAAIVDDAGRPLTGDQAIILLARHMLHPRRHQGGEKVVCDIKCSKAVLDAIAAARGVPLLERSGHAFIRARMIAEGALLGGELSGHFFYRELEGGDDGLFTILRIAELAQLSPKPLSAIVGAMPHYATTPDIRLDYPAADGPQRLEELAAAAQACPERSRRGEVLRLDGVRVAYPDGWGLARVSVTEPLLTFRFEAYTGSPRAIAERFLAAAPDLRQAVLERLDALGSA